MRLCPLAVLPEHPAKFPVLAKNGIIYGREDHTHQDGTRVISVLKEQGGQVHIVTLSHPRVSPYGRGFPFFDGGATASAVASECTFGPKNFGPTLFGPI